MSVHHLAILQKENFKKIDEKIQNRLEEMTELEIELMPMSRLAKEIGISRCTLYRHQEACRKILEIKKQRKILLKK